MGFLDKIKSMKNVITGGAAKVYLDSPLIQFGEKFELVIRVEVDNADVKIDRVYIEIKGVEEVEVPDTDVLYEQDGTQERRREIVRAEKTTIDLEITVADAQILSANEQCEWRATVELPSHALPPYQGIYCHHAYRARASLDCFGNDPDSGWIDLDMNRP